MTKRDRFPPLAPQEPERRPDMLGRDYNVRCVVTATISNPIKPRRRPW